VNCIQEPHCQALFKEKLALFEQYRKLFDAHRHLSDEHQKVSAIYRSETRSIKLLNEIGSYCAAANSDYETCLHRILDGALRLTGADKGNLQLYDRESSVLRIVAQQGFSQSFLDAFATIREDDPAASAAAHRTQERIEVRDIAESAIFRNKSSLPVLLEEGVKAVVSTPLVSSTKATLGVISVYFCDRYDAVPRKNLSYLDLLARNAADYLERMANEAALEEADRRKTEFLAILAHELRNPLAPLVNGIALLRLLKDDREAVDETIDMMERQIEHMTHLVNDLLDISRVNRDKIALTMGSHRLPEIVNRAVEMCEPLVKERQHALHVDVTSEPIFVFGDGDRLSQILTNLLNNAAKYTDPGGRIDLSAHRENGQVIISVKDNGIGIPHRSLSMIFEMFSQVDKRFARGQGGLGVGLSLVKKLVGLHSGTVMATSEGEGKGSEFVVRLPAGQQIMEQEVASS
jgi:signal transduction histidine kinase